MAGNRDQPDPTPKGGIAAGPGPSAQICRRRPERLNLALQGGGAHGAFTWGVLARLLEAGIRIEGISGASAGALNAVVLAAGWLRCGGASGAVEALDELWREIGRLAQLSPLRAGGLTQMAADFAAQYLSPYQLNPLGANPLRAVLERLVDFERLRAADTPRLFIAATSVATACARIFRNPELSVDAVLASACLPQVHPAITIDGEPYWDGGFSANPPLVALVEGSPARDLVLVQINPLRAERTPRTPLEIRNRMAEIAFGRPLAEELERLRRAAKAFGGPIAWLSTHRRRLLRHRLHTIDGSAELSRLDPRTKVDPTWPLLLELRERGWMAADTWLRGRGDRSTAPAAAVKLAPEMQRRAG
ncbi:MAG TPA: patatin-like phospholipase family protein [Geminicoccaceae bacterium]|nr:patatin-like phospholipase family protein [Geminicoccaceae bacterium]